jgi:hypothetical protein
MIEQSNKFEGWAVVEMLGHKKLSGFVTEQPIAGAALLQVDVPETTHRKHVGGFDGHVVEVKAAYSKLIGVGSIYCMTPCTEEVARAVAQELERYNDPLPVTLPKYLAAVSSPTEEPTDADILDDDLTEEDGDRWRGSTEA